MKRLVKLYEEEVNLLKPGQVLYDRNGIRVEVDEVFCDGELGLMVQDVNGNHYFADDLYWLI